MCIWFSIFQFLFIIPTLSQTQGVIQFVLVSFVEWSIVDCWNLKMFFVEFILCFNGFKKKGFLSEKACFSIFLTIKVKHLDEMIQSAYSCAILYVKHKKLPFFASSATTLILLCQRLSTNGKVVLKYCNISKTLERGSINPLPLCSTQGVWICVYVRRSMYLILTIFLYLLVNRFAVRISLPFIYGIAYKLFLPIQEPTTEAPSKSIRFCLKTEFFSPLVPPIVYM